MSPELEQFVQMEVESGRYPNREAFIDYAIRLAQIEREETLAGIQAGLDDVSAGRTQSLDIAIAEIRQSVNTIAE